MAVMNRLFNFAVAVVLALSGAVSCDKAVDTEESFNSFFRIEGERLVNVEVNGGKFSVDYVIEGPMEGNKATVTTGTPWIHVGNVYNTTFSFVVDRNDSGADRTGEIVMNCKGTRPVTIHVMQAKEKSDRPIFTKFDIRVSDISSFSARVQVIPVDAAISYLYSIVSKADYDGVGATGYIETRIGQIKEYSAMMGADPNMFLNKGTFDTSALSPEQAPSLLDDTAYYVAIFDLKFDADGKASYSGDVEIREFRTLKATQVDMSFSLAMNGTVLTVKPSGNHTYIYDVVSREIWDSYGSPEEVARDYVATMKSFGQLGNFIFSGVKSEDFSSTIGKGGAFVAYAVGYRNAPSDSGLTTEVEHIEFNY